MIHIKPQHFVKICWGKPSVHKTKLESKKKLLTTLFIEIKKRHPKVPLLIVTTVED